MGNLAVIRFKSLIDNFNCKKIMEYIVVYGAKINCEYGSTDSTFLEVPYDGCTIDDKNPVLESNLNIGDFVFCTLREQACVFK